MKTIKIYTFSELPEETQEKLIEQRKRSRECDSDIPWRDEIFDSLKALIKHTSGAKLRDYSLGMDSYSFLKVDFPDNVEHLTGARALGWLENNLLSNLRITRSEYLKKRKDFFGYGPDYRIGKIKPCPFTGYCADEDYLESLQKSLKTGRTLKEAYQDLADVYAELVRSEYEHYTSEEEIRESLLWDECHYTKEGIEV